jgi:hypothetical protein
MLLSDITFIWQCGNVILQYKVENIKINKAKIKSFFMVMYLRTKLQIKKEIILFFKVLGFIFCPIQELAKENAVDFIPEDKLSSFDPGIYYIVHSQSQQVKTTASVTANSQPLSFLPNQQCLCRKSS